MVHGCYASPTPEDLHHSTGSKPEFDAECLQKFLSVNIVELRPEIYRGCLCRSSVSSDVGYKSLNCSLARPAQQGTRLVLRHLWSTFSCDSASDRAGEQLLDVWRQTDTSIVCCVSWGPFVFVKGFDMRYPPALGISPVSMRYSRSG